ncbi:MAG: septum formation protein Maf [Planctomycetes bacterium]|nr:septum formation protein Maf [Planctomycetota bacterium]
MMPLIILASASPRRSQILAECGITHKIVVSNAREVMDRKRTPAYNARFNAGLKARAVARRVKKGFVIGADTIVQSGRKLIGKPRDKAEARRLLMEFSGRTIGVYTGLCVINAVTGKEVKSVVDSKVKVKKITPGMAGRFMRVAGPLDKAGGFSIEGPGSFIFDDVQGSFYNVLGLPMIELYRLFGELGVDLLLAVRTK